LGIRGWPSGKALRAAGVLLFSYARLKLELTISGRDARLHAYDWCLGIGTYPFVQRMSRLDRRHSDVEEWRRHGAESLCGPAETPLLFRAGAARQREAALGELDSTRLVIRE